MTQRATALSYAIRFRVLLMYFGKLCILIGVLTLVPFVASLTSSEPGPAARYAILIFALGALGAALGRLHVDARVQTNEAMVLAALMFLFSPLIMSYPMMAMGLPFFDAFFEAVSAITTTGLTTLPTVENKSSTFLLARSWMQWYGGLGIVVLSLALVVRPGMAAKDLAITEAETDDLVGGTKIHARKVLVVYSLLTGIGALCLWGLGAEPFYAVLYTLAAVSTGGFAPHDNSLAGLGSWPVHMLVVLVCLGGAVPLIFYYRLYWKRWRGSLSLLQLQMLFITGFAVTLLMGLCMRSAEAASWLDILRHAPFLAFSAQTTAGFSTMDVSQLDGASKLLLIFSMTIGGSVGSTAGGFKMLRFLIMMKLLLVMIRKTCLAKHAVLRPWLLNRRLEDDEIQEALLIILLYIMVIMASWLPFLAMGYAPLDSLFEVVSATGTVGLSSGITGPELPTLLKGVICADMLMGRLEIVAWLVVLNPGTWIGRRLY